MPLQINTTLHGAADPYLEEMVELVKKLGIVFWEVFFLVPMGRGTTLTGLTALQCEEVFEVLYRVQKENKFLVKVTEAPHYRRYVAQREAEEAARAATAGTDGSGSHAGAREIGPPIAIPGVSGRAMYPHGADGRGVSSPFDRRPGAVPASGSPAGAQAGHVTSLPKQLIRTEGPGHSIGLASQGVNSGNGFLFVSHLGEIFPSGFLPIKAGTLRDSSLASIYRDSPLFRALRDPDRFTGVCGACEYNRICGGSRSRAYAMLGSYTASDPWCGYRPAGYTAPAHPSHGLPVVS
jgi:MoaA/NifB/PqqE/SkfB family radical SAM enzyme